MKISYMSNLIRIDQEKYLNDISVKYQMESSKPTMIPAVVKEKCDRNTKLATDRNFYMSIVGSFIYLSVVTRPDIVHATKQASRYMTDPKKQDMVNAKRILRYLNGTKSFSIIYIHSNSSELVGYTDANWAGNLETRKSTTGYIFIIAGATISWSSKRQPTIALSTMEAKYMATCAATQEVVYLRMFLKDMNLEQMGPTILYQNNQAAIVIVKDHFKQKIKIYRCKMLLY
jgi:hypothetical protein